MPGRLDFGVGLEEEDEDEDAEEDGEGDVGHGREYGYDEREEGEETEERDGKRERESLPTSPLQIVKKSPSLRVQSPASVGRSVSFGSVGGALREDDEEGELGELERELSAFGGVGGEEGSLGEGEEGEEEGSVYGDDDDGREDRDEAQKEKEEEREEGEDTERRSIQAHHPHPTLDLSATLHASTGLSALSPSSAPSLYSPASQYSPSLAPPDSSVSASFDQHSHPDSSLSASFDQRSPRSPPDSSFSASFGQRLSIQSNASDGEVGIGLSLLANLVGGDGSDSESEDEDGGDEDAGLKGSTSTQLEAHSHTSDTRIREPVASDAGDTREEQEDKTEGDTPSTLDFPMPPTTYAANLISTAHGPGSVRSSAGSISFTSPVIQQRGSVSSQHFMGGAGAGRTVSSGSLGGVGVEKVGTPTSPTFPGGVGGGGGRSPTSPSFSVASFGAASGEFSFSYVYGSSCIISLLSLVSLHPLRPHHLFMSSFSLQPC